MSRPGRGVSAESELGGTTIEQGITEGLPNRLAIRYAIDGDLRFISHHDTLRLFERAIARGGIPIRFSQGFNPRPKMRIALPRPVGVASDDELLLVDLASRVEAVEILGALRMQAPGGLSLVSAEPVAKGDRRLPCRATYGVAVDSPSLGGRAARIEAFMERSSHEVKRIGGGKGPIKVVEIRQYVEAMTAQGGAFRWSQSISTTGTVRVNEILEAVGLPSGDYLHRVRRETVAYQA